MEWINWVNDPSAWVSLATLTFLEIVLGIDNVYGIFGFNAIRGSVARISSNVDQPVSSMA